MFMVDEATAEAIRRAYDEGGELSAVASVIILSWPIQYICLC